MQNKQENVDSTIETQQQVNSFKSWATEANRKFLSKLNWIIVYYLSTDVLKTYLLLLYCTQSTGCCTWKPAVSRRAKNRNCHLSSFPHKKTCSFLVRFSARPSLNWLTWGQASASGTWEWQGSTARETREENGTTTLFWQHTAPKAVICVITAPWMSQRMRLLALDEIHEAAMRGSK